MPTYTYKREDGSIFEIDQKITEDALKVCPTTGQKVKRVISGGAGLVFKGSGFYLTDYGKSGSNAAANSGSENKSSSAESKSSGSESKSDSDSSSKKSKAKASDD